MTLSTGATLPDATLMQMGAEGPEAVALAGKLKDRKVVIFGLPGASAPPVGLIDRSKRYAMIVENGVVTAIGEEASPGECDLSAGEALLAQA